MWAGIMLASILGQIGLPEVGLDLVINQLHWWQLYRYPLQIITPRQEQSWCLYSCRKNH